MRIFDTGIQVVPNDAKDLGASKPSGIYVGGTGDLTVVLMANDTLLTFYNVQAGTMLSLRAKRIMATGTTATNILALD